jgi:hypothetical protein
MPKKFKMKRNKFGGADAAAVAAAPKAAPKAAPAPASYTGLILGIFGVLIFLIFCSVAGYFIFDMLNPDQASGTGSTPSGSDSSGGGTPLAVAPPPPKTCASFAGPCAAMKRTLVISTMSTECPDDVCTKELCCPHCVPGATDTVSAKYPDAPEHCHLIDCKDNGVKPVGQPVDGRTLCTCVGQDDPLEDVVCLDDGTETVSIGNNCESKTPGCLNPYNIVRDNADDEGEDYDCCKVA